MPEITSSGFVNRNIIEHLRSDRSRQYRCNTLQNPVAYYDGEQFHPVSIADVASTFNSKSEGIYLRDKSIVSVGVKQADDAYKFIGLRPDEKQDGSEQLEFSLESIEVNGKPQTIDLSTKTAISSLSHDLGPLVVQSRRQGTRIMLPLTNADEGFKIALRLHLKGLTVKYREDLDEYWIFNEKGQFRFRLCKPLLIDPMTGEPLTHEDELGHYDGLVNHSLTELGADEYLYVKDSTEAFGKMKLPEKVLVDADIKYSTTADGRVRYSGSSNWATTHDATTGNQVSTSETSLGYAISAYSSVGAFLIYRSFFYPDTTGLSGTVTAVSEFLYGRTLAESETMAMKGTQADTLTTADYDSFSGVSYGSVTPWSISGYNEIVFNATPGISDVQAALGGIVKVCNREKPHDFDNATPGTSLYRNGCYFADYANSDHDPYLSITLGATTYTRTGSLDALIQRTGITQSSSMDALLAMTGSRPVSLDALLQAVKSGTLSLDALLQMTHTGAVSLDALIQKMGIIKTSSLDVLLKKVNNTQSSSLDALLKKLGLSQSSSLDAILMIKQSKTVFVDALLKKIKTDQVFLDTMLLSKDKLATASIDGMITLARLGFVNFDSLLALTRFNYFSCDSMLASVKERQIGLGAILWLEGYSISPRSIVKVLEREGIAVPWKTSMIEGRSRDSVEVSKGGKSIKPSTRRTTI